MFLSLIISRGTVFSEHPFTSSVITKACQQSLSKLILYRSDEGRWGERNDDNKKTPWF
jgi:hypothetical protein